MLRTEIEALLKLEDSRISLRLFPHPWKRGSWRVGCNEVWSAVLRVPKLGFYKVNGCSTNHEAASVIYKYYIKDKNNNANNR